MNIIENLEALHSDLVDLIGNIDESQRLHAIIEEYKNAQEPVNCSMCPNNRDVVCAYCEGYGITQDTEGENLPCPQGCQIPVQANVFNAKPHKLFGRYVSYVSSDHPIAIGTNLFTYPPLSDETVKDAERYRWLRDKSTSHKHHSPTVTLMDGYGIKVRYGFHGDPKCQPYMTLSNEVMDSVIDEAMKADK